MNQVKIFKMHRRSLHLSIIFTHRLHSTFSKLSSSISGKQKVSRFNESLIQMISPYLYDSIFSGKKAPLSPSSSLLSLSQQHLKQQNIQLALPSVPLQEITQNNLLLPPLAGSGIRSHFANIASWYVAEYENRISNFVAAISQTSAISSPPAAIPLQSGWTRWNGNSFEVVSHPLENIFVLDVEIIPTVSKYPILATARSASAWYFWLSDEFLSGSAPTKLLSIGQDKLVIAHNASFDRSKVLEEYSLTNDANNKFLCTMALHIAVAGLSSHQRSEFSRQTRMQQEEFECDRSEPEKWVNACALNNLRDCYKFHLRKELDKSFLETLLHSSLAENLDRVQDAAAYCASDSRATAELFAVLWNKFKTKCPHPASFSGILEIGSMFLPCSLETWNDYIQRADKKCEESLQRVEQVLKGLVEKRLDEGLAMSSDSIAEDPWLSFLDWTIVPATYTKARFKKDGSYASNGEPRAKGNSIFFNKPLWYKQVLNSDCQFDLTLNSRLTQILLKLVWNGNPVIFSAKYGWCHGSPQLESDPSVDTSAEKSKRLFIDGYPNHIWSRIPHPSGVEDTNVGSLMTKGFFKAYQSGVLSSHDPESKEFLRMLMQENISCSFWKSYQERIKEQFLPSLSDSSLPTGIIPVTVVMGTVTRRAVEKTWMTAAEAKATLIGTELKSRIMSPAGWCIVGADVDSQELWIASVMGDSQFGWHAATSLGWMTLQGNKADRSDMHSRTAEILGISRNDAKVFNYGRIYGAGAKSSAILLSRQNPSLLPDEAKRRVSELFLKTKGKRTKVDKRFMYCGGSESFMFNFLEKEATSDCPRTPALSSSISDSLLKENVDKEFITSRVNWVVQSSGVDYLHLLVTAMSYLISTYKINARLMITIHDEVRYLVKEEDKHRLALALQISNLWTRCMFSAQLGMNDLPLSVAFFSAVDFDHVLRKEPSLPCVSPSTLTAIEPGYSLDIYQLLEKVKSLGDSVKKIDHRFTEEECDKMFGMSRSIERLDFLQKQAGIKNVSEPVVLTINPIGHQLLNRLPSNRYE